MSQISDYASDYFMEGSQKSWKDGQLTDPSGCVTTLWHIGGSWVRASNPGLGWSQALLTPHSSKFQASSSKFQASSKLEAHATSLTISVFGTPLAPTESLNFVLLVIFNGQSLTGHHIT